MPKLNNNIIINIVGRGTEILKKELTDCRIRIYGSVDSLAPYYMGADVIIAPLFDGGGMKTKTVEALSYGKSIVATDEGLEGFWQEMDVLALVRHIHGAENDVVMQMALVNVSGNHIGVYAKNRTENGATGRTWHEFLRGRGTNHGLQKNAGSVRMAVTLSVSV